jgi:ABC-type bacteriocin/lantibiotic exporter with double-glycine peptidase domain
MLTNQFLVRILRESALLLKHEFNAEQLFSTEINNRVYNPDEFQEFKRDLLEAGTKIRLMLLEYALSPADFTEVLKKEKSYVLAFQRSGGEVVPVIIHPGQQSGTFIQPNTSAVLPLERASGEWLSANGQVIFFVIFPYQSLVSEYDRGGSEKSIHLSPVSRLLRLLNTERTEIIYILFYAVIVGLISLVLPLGIQTTVELISGGVFFSSVYVLIGIVILGVLVSGALQIVQISLVEFLQRRIFAKASFEFAFRIPRLKAEAIFKNYAPELVNRFFDVMTIQKGLPKLLIDLSSGLIQIFFGLLLLSLYHPFFVFFSLVLVLLLVAIFYFTGPKGLSSSIEESKYKYKVAHWLEELARALKSFKLAGTTDLPLKRTDYNVNNYLRYRAAHFNVLVLQYSFILFFKAAVTGSLLIVGTILVVDRQITLGQFVAAEVIIILVLSSVEKIIMYMDVIYDMLTAVDKVAHVTDLPLEKTGGLDFPTQTVPQGYAVRMHDLSYQYSPKSKAVLKNINLEIKPGEHVCICGPGGSGKTTLTNILAGIYTDYEGVVTINNYSLRDLDLTHLRDRIAKNISQEDIFDGTILENITLGKPTEKIEDAMYALKRVGVEDDIHRMPDGVNTHLTSGGRSLSNTMVHKLILARCLAKKPELILLNDFFDGLKRAAKIELIQCLVDKTNRWTLVAVSNDPLIMAACDRIVILDDGAIQAEGKFDALMKEGVIDKYID